MLKHDSSVMVRHVGFKQCVMVHRIGFQQPNGDLLVMWLSAWVRSALYRYSMGQAEYGDIADAILPSGSMHLIMKRQLPAFQVEVATNFGVTTRVIVCTLDIKSTHQNIMGHWYFDHASHCDWSQPV